MISSHVEFLTFLSQNKPLSQANTYTYTCAFLNRFASSVRSQSSNCPGYQGFVPGSSHPQLNKQFHLISHHAPSPPHTSSASPDYESVARRILLPISGRFPRACLAFSLQEQDELIIRGSTASNFAGTPRGHQKLSLVGICPQAP